VDAKVLKECSVHACHVKKLIVTYGAPCQNVSGLNPSGGGIEGSKSSLVWEVPRVLSAVQEAWPDSQVAKVGEMVASVSAKDQEVYDKINGQKAVYMCPGTCGWMKRPRIYWPNFPLLSGAGVAVSQQPRWTVIKLHSKRMGISKWLPRGWSLHKDFVGFSTFTRAIVRKKPPFMPAGIERLKKHELARYQQWNFRYPPYQMQDKYMLINARRQMVPAPSEVREVLMGFRKHHTFHCWSSSERRESPAKHEVARCALLGNAFHAPTMAWILSNKLCGWGLLPRPLSCDEVADVNKAIVWESSERTNRLIEGTDRECLVALVRQLMARQSMRGGALSSTAAILVFKGAMPESVDPEYWHWRTCLAVAWKHHGEHINVLEMRAIALALSWRLRNSKHLGTRFLHLVDSMVCLMSLLKGRSSSLRLNGAICKCNSLIAAGFLAQVLGHVRTALNPSDRPSRFAERKAKGQCSDEFSKQSRHTSRGDVCPT